MVILFALVLMGIVVVNLLPEDERLSRWVSGVVVLGGVGLVGMALVLAVVSRGDIGEGGDDSFRMAVLMMPAVQVALFFLGGWIVVVGLPVVRRRLGEVTALKPASLVHLLALLMIGLLLTNALFTLALGSLEAVAATAEGQSVWATLSQPLFFSLVAIVGVGYGTRRSGEEVLARLGVGRLSSHQISLGMGLIVALFVMQLIGGLVWGYLNPDEVALLGEINSEVLREFDTFWEWLLLALFVGVGEELLFRG
ncbi:MAG TPA: hypothetical protein VLL52_25020, partial [Anaerolineae bacterium]|nr:hypothetical protein [Anaerolineae bacterium]